MEVVLALIAVLLLAWVNHWNEKRLAQKIDRSMDKMMGRDDD